MDQPLKMSTHAAMVVATQSDQHGLLADSISMPDNLQTTCDLLKHDNTQPCTLGHEEQLVHTKKCLSSCSAARSADHVR